MSFTLGPYTFDQPVILAPMSGITDLPFRRLVADFGADLVVSEMIASGGVIHENRESAERGATWAEEKPRVIQLAGVDPHLMAQAARLCQQRGCDIVDINMGCPVKRVVSGCAEVPERVTTNEPGSPPNSDADASVTVSVTVV